MSMRHRGDTNHRFTLTSDNDNAVIMDTSIGSDGERSDNDYDADYVTPSMTPVSVSGAKLSNGTTSEFVFNLKFSIENILKPEFGCQTRNSNRMESSDTSRSPSAYVDSPSPLISPQGQHRNGGRDSTTSTVGAAASSSPGATTKKAANPSLWPAWVYCTRYSDRPSSGPRCRRVKRTKSKQEEKRPRTAFTTEQLSRLKGEFQENRYLTEKRRQDLARDLGLNESQIKIWFQNKRAKIKKQTGGRNMLALHLLAQGLYNHATIPVITDDMSLNRDENGEIDNGDSDNSSEKLCDSQ